MNLIRLLVVVSMLSGIAAFLRGPLPITREERNTIAQFEIDYAAGNATAQHFLEVMRM